MSASSIALRLVVVEHQAGLRELLRKWLEGLDSFVCECASANEALRLGDEFRPDWVLVDVQLTTHNALSALRQLRKRFDRARFVLISDFDDEVLRLAAREVTGHFLLKEELSKLPAVLASSAAIHPDRFGNQSLAL